MIWSPSLGKNVYQSVNLNDLRDVLVMEHYTNTVVQDVYIPNFLLTYFMFCWSSCSNGMLGIYLLTQTNSWSVHMRKKGHIRLCNSILLQIKLFNLESLFTIQSNLVSCQYFSCFMVITIELFYQMPISGKSDRFTHRQLLFGCGYTYFSAEHHWLLLYSKWKVILVWDPAGIWIWQQYIRHTTELLGALGREVEDKLHK